MHIPDYYTETPLEYRAVRETVGIADLSDEGALLVAGADRTDFLQNLISNDIHLATEHQGIFATALTAKGKVIAAFNLYRLPDAYLLTMESSLTEKTREHLMRFKFRSKIEITAPPWGKFLVAGPHAKNLVEQLLQRKLPAMTAQSFFYQEADPTFCVRQTQTGEEEYHLYCDEKNKDDMGASLIALGVPLGAEWIGQAALDVIYLEAGLPRYGIDLSEEILPNEAGLEASAISYTKGCYPGQEVIARIKTYGHINKHRVGLILEGDQTALSGEKIFSGDQEIGRVLASNHSPFLKKPIATAFLRSAFAKEGEKVTVPIEGLNTLATVTPLPFYQRG
ncbi:MAG: glycine cleavage T C-terminal barrel domain-containing protein [Nitrospirota bacterium]